MEVLAQWLARYAGWILLVVVVLLVICGLYSTNLSSRLSGAGWTVPGSEEARAEQAQDAGFVGRGSSSVTLAGSRRQVQRAVDRIRPARRWGHPTDRRRSTATGPRPGGLDVIACGATG
jgi:uncharacterized membrane protein YdfJ with MMPL/SSD domain